MEAGCCTGAAFGVYGAAALIRFAVKVFKVKSTCLARWALAQTSQGAFPGQGPLEPQPCYLCMCLASR